MLKYLKCSRNMSAPIFYTHNLRYLTMRKVHVHNWQMQGYQMAMEAPNKLAVHVSHINIKMYIE